MPLFQNVYLRETDNARIPAGIWETREQADHMAEFNERAGFTRVECREVPESANDIPSWVPDWQRRRHQAAPADNAVTTLIAGLLAFG